jgi:hypothetical protein
MPVAAPLACQFVVYCRSKVLTKRTIDHPNFQNISMVEAVQSLIRRPKGEAIFRPSPKSTDLICLSIKVCPFPPTCHAFRLTFLP